MPPSRIRSRSRQLQRHWITTAPSGRNKGTEGNAGDPRCDESVTRACAAAVKELLAARDLIGAQSKEIDALKARIAIEQERAGLIQGKLNLMADQNQALVEQVAASADAKTKQEQLLETYRAQIAKMEEDRRGGRRRTLWAAIGGFVLGVTLIRR